MADLPPSDRAKLKAWYAANFQPAPGAKPAAAKPPTAAHLPVASEPPAADEQNRAADHTAREAAEPSAAEQRRADLEFIRHAARKKSLRWRLALFCFMLAGTVVASIAIYVVIQVKFNGKIPYFQSLD